MLYVNVVLYVKKKVIKKGVQPNGPLVLVWRWSSRPRLAVLLGCITNLQITS